MDDIDAVLVLLEQIKIICDRHVGDVRFNTAFVEALRQLRDDLGMDDDFG